MKDNTFIASEYFADHELSQEYFHAICIDNLSGINTQDTVLVSKLITSVEKALEHTAELRNILEQKQKFERALKKLNQCKLEIEALRQDILNQM